MRYKHFLVVLFILLLGVSSTQAQRQYDRDISVGYGYISSNRIAHAAGLGTGIFTFCIFPFFDCPTLTNHTQIGAVGLSYKKLTGKKQRLTMGGTLSYEYIGYNLTFGNTITDDKTTDYLQFHFLTGTYELDYRYISKEKFQMYFSVGAGVSILSHLSTPQNYTPQDQNSWEYLIYPNFHANALGFRFGKSTAVFAELGLGYKGIVNVGLSFQPKLK